MLKKQLSKPNTLKKGGLCVVWIYLKSLSKMLIPLRV